MAGLSPSCRRPTGPDSSAPLGNASSTSNTPGATSCFTGPGHRHNTDRQTAFTDKCASAPHTGNFLDHRAKFSSPPANPWSPATSGSATSAPPPSPPGHTCTRRATASGGWARLPTARPRTLPRTALLGRLLHHSVPGRSEPDQDQPPACPLHYCQGRHLRVVMFTTPWNWEPSPRGTAEFRCFPRNAHCSRSPHLVSFHFP